MEVAFLEYISDRIGFVNPEFQSRAWWILFVPIVIVHLTLHICCVATSVCSCIAGMELHRNFTVICMTVSIVGTLNTFCGCQVTSMSIVDCRFWIGNVATFSIVLTRSTLIISTAPRTLRGIAVFPSISVTFHTSLICTASR